MPRLAGSCCECRCRLIDVPGGGGAGAFHQSATITPLRLVGCVSRLPEETAAAQVLHVPCWRVPVVKLILCVHVMPSINICKVGSQWRLWARTDEMQACGLLSHAHLHTGFRVVELLG